MQVGDLTKQIASNQLPSPFVGTATRDMSIASGTSIITGVGFTPSYVSLLASRSGTIEALSIGNSNVTTNNGVYRITSSGAWLNTDSLPIRIDQAGSGAYSGSIASFDSDGFTITWTKAGSPTGNLILKFTAFK